MGPLCEYKQKVGTTAEQYDSFSSYSRDLTLVCPDENNYGEYTWMPDENTPNTVYYQVGAHYMLIEWYLFIKPILSLIRESAPPIK